MRFQDLSFTPSDGQRRWRWIWMPIARVPPQEKHGGIPSNKVSFREAKAESVSSFDEYNIPLAQFVRTCRAREIIPLSSEKNPAKILVNKLRGRAYYAVEDEPYDTITQLINLLNGAFESS